MSADTASADAPDDIAVSVVSHGHGPVVRTLLSELAALRSARRDAAHARVTRVLITLNVPEPELAQRLAGREWPFALKVIENPAPRSFAANHNAAFARLGGIRGCPVFVVLNPDVRLRRDPFPALCAALEMPRIGLAYPEQRDATGRPQDYARAVPTPGRLLARHLLRREASLDRPEWVSGAFMALRAEAFAAVEGFDENYRMYVEDVDLCLRLQNAGWRLGAAPGAVVEHAGARRSRRNPTHFTWHVASLWRLWNSAAWHTFQHRQREA